VWGGFRVGGGDRGKRGARQAQKMAAHKKISSRNRKNKTNQELTGSAPIVCLLEGRRSARSK